MNYTQQTSRKDRVAGLVACHAPAIYRLALCVTGDRADAEDILQCTFRQACSRLGRQTTLSRIALVHIAVKSILAKFGEGIAVQYPPLKTTR